MRPAVDPQISMALEGQRPELHIEALCTEEERAVARALDWGRARAQQIPVIARVAGVPDRQAQDIVQHLLFDHQWPIGTSMGEPYGNYLIDTATDLALTVDLLRKRGLSNLARAAALKKQTLEQYIRFMQGTLDLNDWRQ